MFIASKPVHRTVVLMTAPEAAAVVVPVRPPP